METVDFTCNSFEYFECNLVEVEEVGGEVKGRVSDVEVVGELFIGQ